MVDFQNYDLDLQFRKISSKYVEDNASTLQMMRLTETAGSIFPWYDNFDLLESMGSACINVHARHMSMMAG